jgi:hypothetical protein
VTPGELKALAQKSVDETPNGFEPKIDLIIPGRWGKSNKKRLAKGSPVGDIVQETQAGLTVIFNAKEILEWLKGLGI